MIYYPSVVTNAIGGKYIFIAIVGAIVPIFKEEEILGRILRMYISARVQEIPRIFPLKLCE